MRDFVKEIDQIDIDAQNTILEMMRYYGVEDFVLQNKYVILYYTGDSLEKADICRVHLGGADYDEVVLYSTDKMMLFLNDFVSGTMASFVDIVRTELELLNKRAEEQDKLVAEEPKWEKRFFFLPDKHNPRELDDEDFASLAFMYGKVMTMEEFAYAFNHYQLDNIHPDVGEIRVLEYSDTCVEMCPYCDREVVLKTDFKMQVCPICGKPIAPCNLCGGNCQNKCPLHCQ